MAGNNHTNRMARQQFDMLDLDAKRILQTAYTEEPEEVAWTTETIFSRKKNQITVRVYFDTKLKLYIVTENNSIVPENQAIKIHLDDMYIHYRYHPEKKTHVHITDPPRSEVGAKYITTAQNCHLIKGRDITVGALLAYAAQKAGTTTTSLCNTIKDAPTEETVNQ